MNNKLAQKIFLLSIVIASIVFLATCSSGIADSVLNPDLNAASKPANTAPKTWTVTLDLNGGTGIDQLTYTVNDGATFDLTTQPTFTGHSFSGYKDDKGNTFTFATTKVTQDTTITAQWDLLLWTLTVNLNGGSTTASTTINNIIHDSTVPALDPAPTRPYRALLNYLDTNNTAFVFGTTKVTQNMTVTAQWGQVNISQMRTDLYGYWLKKNDPNFYTYYIFSNNNTSPTTAFSAATLFFYSCKVDKSIYPDGVGGTSSFAPNYSFLGGAVACSSKVTVTLSPSNSVLADVNTDATSLISTSHITALVNNDNDIGSSSLDVSYNSGSTESYNKIQDLN